jgi:hypothetical protein
MSPETLEKANKISAEIKQLDELIGQLTCHKLLPVAITVKVITFLPLLIGIHQGKVPTYKGDEPELVVPKAVADKLLPLCIERRAELREILENL